MALNWNWSSKMGKMVVTQDNKKFKVNIYQGNATAIFIYEYKDAETKKNMYNLWTFFADKAHIKNILKNNNNVLFSDEVSNIELDMKYTGAKELLPFLLDLGYSVKVYKSK